MKGPEFLKKKYNLHATPEVEGAAERTEERTGERVTPPLDTIQNYLDRFKEISERKDDKNKARGLRALKKVLYENFVMRAENIPESYFTLQQQIAREIGHGTIEITPELRKESVKVIQADQRASLGEWVDYLSSRDALYPDWAKYWAFRGVLGMSLYDKEKKQFGNRTKSTTAKFPDLNPEALSYVVDLLQKKLKGETVKNPVEKGENEFADEGKLVTDEDFEKLVSTESFPTYYAFAIEHVVSDNSELFKITEGEWRVFKEGSDPLELTNTLQGHGTGWCTAGESTAASQLEAGDFYVYYSNNAHGDPTIPRLAIRMEYGAIAEVRGVAHKQEIDPYISPILEQKLTEFGEEGEEYKKKAEDMKRLTDIDRMVQASEELDAGHLKFIYEVNGSIEGFGYSRDPRISEIRESRDQLTDLKVILEVIDDNDFITKFLGMESKLKARFLGAYEEGDYTDEEDGIDWDKYDEALVKFLKSYIPQMKSLNSETTEKILDAGYGSVISTAFNSVDPKERLKVLAMLIRYDNCEGTTYHQDLLGVALKDASTGEKVAFIENQIQEQNFDDLENVLKQTTNVPIRIARLLIKAYQERLVAENLSVFAPEFNSVIAEQLIAQGYGAEVAENLNVFRGISADVLNDLNSMGFLVNDSVIKEARVMRKNPFGQYVEMDADEEFIDPSIFDR